MVLDQLNEALERLTDARQRESLAANTGERWRAQAFRESAEHDVQVLRENAGALFAELFLYAMQTYGVAAVVAEQIDKVIPWEQTLAIQKSVKALERETAYLRHEVERLARALAEEQALREARDYEQEQRGDAGRNRQAGGEDPGPPF